MIASEMRSEFERNRLLRKAREAEKSQEKKNCRYDAVRAAPEYVADESQAIELAARLAEAVLTAVARAPENFRGEPSRCASVEMRRSARGYRDSGLGDGVSDAARKELKTPGYVADMVATLDRAAVLFNERHQGFDLELSHYFGHGYDGDHTVIFCLAASF